MWKRQESELNAIALLDSPGVEIGRKTQSAHQNGVKISLHLMNFGNYELILEWLAEE